MENELSSSKNIIIETRCYFLVLSPSLALLLRFQNKCVNQSHSNFQLSTIEWKIVLGEKNSKKWKDYFVNYNAQLGNNTTLHKNHKPHVPVRLLTTGINTAIENLSRFIVRICASLKSNLSNIIKDTSHLLDLIDDINKSSLPDHLILVSFNIINPIQDGLFWGCSQMGGTKRAPVLKFCHTYPTMMKLGTVTLT